jgi:YD repeat-containing protein
MNMWPGLHAVVAALALTASIPAVTHGDTQSVVYGYDGLGRLTSATYDDALTASYTYDAAGNLTAVLVAPGTVSVDDPGLMPSMLTLGPAVPTPFRGSTTLHFDLPRPERVRLTVFDPSGRRVRTLVEGEFASGRHGARWDGRDEHGRRVGSGLYFARLESATGSRIRRIVRLD